MMGQRRSQTGVWGSRYFREWTHWEKNQQHCMKTRHGCVGHGSHVMPVFLPGPSADRGALSLGSQEKRWGPREE